ncbi:MAG: rod shape-determining protein MreC [Bacteroidaceae bacterium]|nr:rod shape-determining protein MreC [Bacteroidaceae bacterium]MBQ2012583.1 rod shape-determining protein MreC [Bacteroidaceae bacterium]MBQ2458455.1 rod shape-determining protein MreC [Bacteroidaceae bacterium]MBQ5741926.1 rod shape-determining protein MreC [Bacteroidaceae bacterium]MBR4405869.1 rod shape-determining protein MreC [Bacteroidaceae bacterium]
MQSFIDRLLQYAHWVLFLILEVLSGWMLFRFNAYQGSVWFTQANAVAGQVLDYEAKLLQFIHLKDLNGQLTQDILQLQQENDSMRTLLAQLTQDSSYTQKIQADLLAGEKLIPAHVISNSIKQKDNFITLDKGSKDGIRTEMGVVSGTGIVGITYLVSNHFSVVLPILNTHSNISCRLRGTNYFGSLKWSGGSPLQAYMDDIPRHARCKIGDVVETSGFSSVFPAGIFVGKVIQINNSKDGLSYRLEVQLSTDLAKIRDVCIVSNSRQAELDSLQRQAK